MYTVNLFASPSSSHWNCTSTTRPQGRGSCSTESRNRKCRVFQRRENNISALLGLHSLYLLRRFWFNIIKYLITWSGITGLWQPSVSSDVTFFFLFFSSISALFKCRIVHFVTFWEGNQKIHTCKANPGPRYRLNSIQKASRGKV